MTMVPYDAVEQLWGEDRLVFLPMAELDEHLAFGDALLPDNFALPDGVGVLFTVDVPAVTPLFAVLDIAPPEERPLRRVVLGATEDDPALLFVLDVDTGAVEILNSEEMTLERINSSLALFVEFLYRIVLLAERSLHPIRVEELRAGLAIRDPLAFATDHSWWHTVFDHLAQA
jgi:hypothetical protein